MKREVRVGLVVLGCIAILAVGLVVIGSRTLLFSERFVIRAQFNQVSGLREGAAVQFQGVSVGAVRSVSLPASPGSMIEVTMGIRPNTQHLIHSQTQAQIKTEGLVGSMIVVLVNPPLATGDLVPVANGDMIVGVDPFDLFEITDKALASVQRFEQSATSFERIVDDIRAGEGTIGKLIYDPELYNSLVATSQETERLLTHLADESAALVEVVQHASSGVESVLSKINEGDGTVARLLNDPQVYETVLSTADTLQVIVTSLRVLQERIEHMTDWGTLGAFRFAELMEAGKHNWLFRRYFEERGYVEQAPFEIRERAITESFRLLEEKEQELLLFEAYLDRQAAQLDSLLSLLDQ